MTPHINQSINNMIENLKDILDTNIQSIYIYGSYALNDFKLGWSDLDLLVLTKEPIPKAKLDSLLYLRQNLLKKEPNNPYYRSFEGAILSVDSFINKTQEDIVYWGTKGEKIKSSYTLDSFSIKEIIENGILLEGEDIRYMLTTPTFDDLKHDVIHHFQTIREHAKKTGRNFYSFGWFLDISRCLYTLQTGKIISKTKAGEWALKNNLCPSKKVLEIVLKIRNNPLEFKNEETLNYAESLGPEVQRYADVLEEYLKNISKQKP